MNSAKRCIIGLGCDPNRAKFAQQNWAPRLGVDMDFAQNLKSLMNQVSSKEYAVVFIAPGMCHLIGEEGSVKVFQQVKAIQPKVKCVLVKDVSQALSVLSKALGLEGFKDVQAMSNDWPFVD